MFIQPRLLGPLQFVSQAQNVRMFLEMQGGFLRKRGRISRHRWKLAESRPLLWPTLGRILWSSVELRLRWGGGGQHYARYGLNSAQAHQGWPGFGRCWSNLAHIGPNSGDSQARELHVDSGSNLDPPESGRTWTCPAVGRTHQTLLEMTQWWPKTAQTRPNKISPTWNQLSRTRLDFGRIPAGCRRHTGKYLADTASSLADAIPKLVEQIRRLCRIEADRNENNLGTSSSRTQYERRASQREEQRKGDARRSVAALLVVQSVTADRLARPYSTAGAAFLEMAGGQPPSTDLLAGRRTTLDGRWARGRRPMMPYTGAKGCPPLLWWRSCQALRERGDWRHARTRWLRVPGDVKGPCSPVAAQDRDSWR